MVHLIHSKPEQLGGWPAKLWQIQQFLGATAWHKPVFHAKSQIEDGQFFEWKAWVTLTPLPTRPDRSRKFFGFRSEEKDAVQDAAREAVLYLRGYYDLELDEGPFDLIPQRVSQGDAYSTPQIAPDDDPRLEVASGHIVFQEAIYSRILAECQTMHRQLFESQRTVRHLQQDIHRLQAIEDGEMSDCGESPDVPLQPPPQPPRGPSPPPQLRRRPTAAEYRRRFRPAAPRAPSPPTGRGRGKGPMTASRAVVAAAAAAAPVEDEDPEDAVRRPSSRPPSSGR